MATAQLNQEPQALCKPGAPKGSWPKAKLSAWVKIAAEAVWVCRAFLGETKSAEALAARVKPENIMMLGRLPSVMAPAAAVVAATGSGSLL